LVCGKCSPYKTTLPKLREEGGSRVCKNCFGLRSPADVYEVENSDGSVSKTASNSNSASLSQEVDVTGYESFSVCGACKTSVELSLFSEDILCEGSLTGRQYQKSNKNGTKNCLILKSSKFRNMKRATGTIFTCIAFGKRGLIYDCSDECEN
jgi:hypothetical protein